MDFYFQNASERVALGFWEEVSSCFKRIKKNPMQYPVKELGLRRCNLKTYPFNILFEDLTDRIRIQVVRHNSRNPKYGTGRRKG